MRKETKIGLMGVIALVILFFGIKFLKGISLFSTQDTYYIKFSNAKGLSKSATVFADGYNVGIVSDITYDKPQEVVVSIQVDPQLRIPKGSSAKLDEGMLGGCTLNMLLATNLTEAFQPGDTIVGSDASGLLGKAEQMLPQVEQVVSRVDTLIASLNRLASDTNLVLILQNAELLTKNLNRSTNELNRLLSKDVPQLTTTFNQVGQNAIAMTDKLNQINLQATMDSVNTTLASIHHMMNQIQDPKGSLGLLMKDPGLYNNLNHTVQSADSLVNDLKAHPKRYVHFSVFGKKDKTKQQSQPKD